MDNTEGAHGRSARSAVTQHISTLTPFNIAIRAPSLDAEHGEPLVSIGVCVQLPLQVPLKTDGGVKLRSYRLQLKAFPFDALGAYVVADVVDFLANCLAAAPAV